MMVGAGRSPCCTRHPFFWNRRRKYGHVLEAALLWARAPKRLPPAAGP